MGRREELEELQNLEAADKDMDDKRKKASDAQSKRAQMSPAQLAQSSALGYKKGGFVAAVTGPRHKLVRSHKRLRSS